MRSNTAKYTGYSIRCSAYSTIYTSNGVYIAHWNRRQNDTVNLQCTVYARIAEKMRREEEKKKYGKMVAVVVHRANCPFFVLFV